MLKRTYLAAGISLMLVMLLGACFRGQTTQRPAPSPEAGAAATPQTQQPPSPTPSRGGDETRPTVEVVKILIPSIVQITTESLAAGIFNQPIPSLGVGTGVILDTNGHIMTNNHVVEGARRITVGLASGDSRQATIVGTDPSTDLAVIRIEADGLQPAMLGKSSELQVGEDVIAIGYALGLLGGPTVSKGVVSALGRTIDTDSQTTIVDLIQTDAEINPGNSGGALVNSKAQVVGINTAIIQSGRGIGFAINIDDAKVVVAQLMEKGFVDRGFLGVSPVSMTPALAKQLGLPTDEGIYVARVVSGSAAERAGLKEGDVIVQLGGETIRNNGELSKFLIAHRPGQTVEVVYYRNGERLSTNITLGERPR